MVRQDLLWLVIVVSYLFVSSSLLIWVSEYPGSRALFPLECKADFLGPVELSHESESFPVV